MKTLNYIFNLTERSFRKILISLLMAGLLAPVLMAGDRGDGLTLERWMAVPFSEDINITRSPLESWMTVPFETAMDERPVNVESWMTLPFDLALEENNVALESWMTLPFSQVFEEDPLVLESWMSVPFNPEARDLADIM